MVLRSKNANPPNLDLHEAAHISSEHNNNLCSTGCMFICKKADEQQVQTLTKMQYAAFRPELDLVYEVNLSSTLTEWM